MKPGGHELLLYAALIALSAIGSAWMLVRRNSSRTPVSLLACAAGVMLGAAFFHMLPEAHARGGYRAFMALPLGFLVLFVLERYAFTHACEEPEDCHERSHNPALGLAAFL